MRALIYLSKYQYLVFVPYSYHYIEYELLKKQLTQKLGCINRASTIDGLLYDFIGNNYKRNMLEEKMINKSDDITNILESSKQSTHQTGGVKTKSMARKRKNLKKRRTLKSLIRYYAN